MAMSKKVAVWVGSVRKGSLNLRLARAIEKLMPAGFTFDYVDMGHLPLYTQDFDADYPPDCQALKRQADEADAFLFATPEYNRSFPGVLKNAIDIASRPYGTNSFAGRPGAVIGTSPGGAGAAMAQQHLRNVLLYLDVALQPSPEVYLQFKDGLIDGEGSIADERVRTFLQGFADKFARWIDAHPRR
jgi:chromate reductase